MPAVIFCNQCFETYSQIKRKFFISSCSHVFCNSCLTNLKNFCPLCKAQCKILEITTQMPSEIRMLFEETSVTRMIQNIKKIETFQENQIRMYAQKMKPHRQNYGQMEKRIQKIKNVKKYYEAKLKAEKELIDRLRHAYKTNNITPDLFTSSSSKNDHQKNFQSPLSTSSRSSSFSSNSGRSPVPKTNSTIENVIARSQKSSPSPRSHFQEPRKKLLELTLRHMQQASQSKFQAARRYQLTK